jgi:hypothetical protein
MTPPALQTLSPGQIKLLIVMTFQHLPQSQKAIQPLLNWQRERLQSECARLTELGWLSIYSGRWGVPSELQERVARYAWRNDLIPAQPAPVMTVRALSSGLETRRLFTRQLRASLYTGDVDGFALYADQCRRLSFDVHPLDEFWRPFDPEWLDWLAPAIRVHLLNRRMLSSEALEPEERAYLETAVFQRPEAFDQEAIVNLAFEALLAGRLEIGQRLVGKVDHPAALACLAFAQVQRGENAIKQYQKARADLRKLTGRRNVVFGGEYGWLELLALIATGDLSEAEKWLIHGPDLPVLRQILQLAQGQDQSAKLPEWKPGKGLAGLLCALLYGWCERTHKGWDAEAKRLQQDGRVWLADQYFALLGKPVSSGLPSLLAVLERKPAWKLALEAMEKLRPAPKAEPAPAHNLRMLWKVDVYGEGTSLGIEPIEQKLTKQGWTAGRAVALKRLAQDYPIMSHLTPADRGICRAIQTERMGYYGQVHISIDHQAAAPYLVGHPLVIRRSTDTPLRVQAVRGRLNMAPLEDGCRVTFEHPKPYAIRGQFLEILQLNACESSLLAILGKGLHVPAAGQEQLAGILRSLSDQILGDLPPDPDLDLQDQLRKALRDS